MVEHSFAFSKLNLRFNPFGELPFEERLKVAVVDVENLVDVLKKDKSAIQFLADHGRGKTTHLIALHRHFPLAPYVKLQRENTVEIIPAEINFIDSLEVLSKRRRKKLFKTLNSFAFTTHSDLNAELVREGFNVTTINVACATVEKLVAIFQRRIEHARRGPGEVPQVPAKKVEELMAQFGDDIRAMEGALYDWIQNMDEIENV